MHAGVRVGCLGAVVLFALGAPLAGAVSAEAGVRLGSHSDAISRTDAVAGLGSYADGDANQFVADADGILGRALEETKSNQRVLFKQGHLRWIPQKVNVPIRYGECERQCRKCSNV